MLYNLHFYKDDKLQETRKEKVYMDNRFVTLEVPYSYDKMMLFDEDSRYIVTYYYVSRYKGKSVFRRN
jgi:hypothetical protein